MYPPGLRFRKTTESLGLTYRDVQKADYEIAVKRGRPDFILHLSRLADIENRNVVPRLHKLYSLAAILHLVPIGTRLLSNTRSTKARSSLLQART